MATALHEGFESFSVQTIVDVIKTAWVHKHYCAKAQAAGDKTRQSLYYSRKRKSNNEAQDPSADHSPGGNTSAGGGDSTGAPPSSSASGLQQDMRTPGCSGSKYTLHALRRLPIYNNAADHTSYLKQAIQKALSVPQEGGAAGSARVVEVALTHANLQLLANTSMEEKKLDFSWFVDVPYRPNWLGFTGYEGLETAMLTKSAEVFQQVFWPVAGLMLHDIATLQDVGTVLMLDETETDLSAL
eukprot:gene4524-4777_t